jgi:hypothetical protein
LNDRTVVRTGWGIFYHQAFYPGWGGGISQDGFSNTPSFSADLGGIRPAFFLDQGFPQNFQRPPDIREDYRNGQGILYRPLDANERPYAHQWNITVDRELGRNLGLSVGYVGSAGRRLPSSLRAAERHRPGLPRARRPADGAVPARHDEPARGAAALRRLGRADDRVRTVGGPGAAAVPAVLQRLQGLNENYGKSLYNSLQMKLEKRFSQGTYALVSYTLSRTLQDSSENTQRDAVAGSASTASSRRSSGSATTRSPRATRRTCCRQPSSTSCRSARASAS